MLVQGLGGTGFLSYHFVGYTPTMHIIKLTTGHKVLKDPSALIPAVTHKPTRT